MKEIRLNLNDSVKVKLTDHGKDIYFHRYDELDKKLGRKPTGHFPPVDEDGYTEFSYGNSSNCTALTLALLSRT